MENLSIPNIPFSILKYDIVFALDENEYLGKKSIQLKVSDLKPAIMPDNPGIPTSSLRKSQDIFNIIRKELDQRRPVVLVYPTYRTLNKHNLTLKDMFNPKCIITLHGRIYEMSAIDCKVFWKKAVQVFF